MIYKAREKLELELMAKSHKKLNDTKRDKSSFPVQKLSKTAPKVLKTTMKE